MVELAHRNSLLLQVDFHKRYDPYHIEIKQLLDYGKFGELLYGYCYMEDQIVVPRDWFKDWVHLTSPLWFLGVNFIDLISWFLNAKVESVYAKGQQKKLKNLGYNTFDSVQAMICYDNDAVITFDNSWILPEQYSSIVNQGFRLIGTEGIVESNSHNRGTTSCFSSESGVRNHNSGFIYSMNLNNDEQIYAGYGIQSIQHFADNISYIKNGGSLEELEGTYPSGKDGHQVNEIIDAIQISLKSGEKVSLNQNTIRVLQNAK
jgi:predicted dehydrogenase